MLKQIKLKALFVYWSFLACWLYLFLQCIGLFSKKKVVFYVVESQRIGEFVADMMMLLRRLKSESRYNENNIFIAFCGEPVCNRQLFNMFKQQTAFFDNRLLRNILMCTWIRKTDHFLELQFHCNEFSEFNINKPILSFNEKEEDLGRAFLHKMGLKEGDWFICFHARSAAYINNLDHYYINNDINNYLKAAEYIAEIGGYAIRVGSVVDKPLPKKRHPKIIDYSSDYRSDFMDIYLPAKCKFYLGSQSGLFLVPTIFKVPVACANVSPLEQSPYRKGDLFIPKKLWSSKENRFLTFKEILTSDLGHCFSSTQYERAGIKPVENSAEDILELAKEMNEIIDGKYVCTAEDEELQIKFKQLFKPNHISYGSPARIGTCFIRQNKELLN